WKELGPVPDGDAAHPGANLAEDRRLRGDRQIAEQIELVATSNAPPAYFGDDRLACPSDGVGQAQEHPSEPAAGIGVEAFFELDVPASAEGAVAGSGEHNDSDVLGAVSLVE